MDMLPIIVNDAQMLKDFQLGRFTKFYDSVRDQNKICFYA